MWASKTSGDGVPSSRKVHTVRVEGKIKGISVNGGAGLRLMLKKMMTYKGSLIEGGFGEDPPMLKSMRWLERKKQ